MSDYFVLLLEQVTIFSSVTALILIAVKQLFKCRIPPRIGMALWIILLARLVCPVFPESRISVYNLIPAGKDVLYAIRSGEEEEIVPEEAYAGPSENPYVLTEVGEEPEEPAPVIRAPAPDYTIGGYLTDGSEAERDLVNRTVVLVYLCGVGVSLGGSLLAYEAARRRALRGAIPVEDEGLLRLYGDTAMRMGLRIERLPRLCYGSASMLAGAVNPTVICRETDFTEAGGPDAERAAERAARMVFAHELTHYRYGDNQILVFSTFVNCLFWYNPLIWVVRRMMREDVEVLCDARTLEFCGIPSTEYAMMLCRESAFDTLSDGMGGVLAAEAGCRMSRKGRHLRNRLLTISRWSRRRLLPRAAAWMLCASIIAVCLTNPVMSSNGAYETYVSQYAQRSGADRETLMRRETATVADYLSAVSLLLEQSADVRVPSGLEQLRREIDARYGDVHGRTSLTWLKRELARYKADEVLTERSAAAVSEAVEVLLGIPFDPEVPSAVLPAEISEAQMQRIAEKLGDARASLLLSAYNKGVRGAQVSFEAFYTGDMMDLILSRIHNDWAREKFRGFYQRIDLTPENIRSFSDELSTAVNDRWTVQSVYIRDPGLTAVEEAALSGILGAAMAGEREDVYYLKQTEDGVSRETAARLLQEAGVTPMDCLCDSAMIGDLGGALTDRIRAVRGGLVEEGVSGIALNLIRSEELFRMLDRCCRTGLTDIPESGDFDPGRKLSAGEGIARAYRFAAALTGVPAVQG